MLVASGVSCVLTGARAEYVYLTRGDGSDGRSFSDGANWSDGQAPNSGADYLVALGGDEGGVAAEALGMNMAAFGSSKTFGGRSLTLGLLDGLGGFVEHRTTKQLTYNNLTLNKGCYYASIKNSTTLAGTWTVASPLSASFSFTSTVDPLVVTVKASITGAAGTCLQVRSSAFCDSELGMTELDFTGDNSAYAGSFKVAGPKNRIKFASVSALGASATPVILADRGILVCDGVATATGKKVQVEATGGCLEVPADTTASFAMTLSGDGVAKKTGAGVLAFAGAVDGIDLEVVEGELAWQAQAELQKNARIVVGPGAFLSAAGELKQTDFKACGGVVARRDAYDQISPVTLTDSCTVEWPMTLALGEDDTSAAAGASYPVVRIPVSLKTVDREDFRLDQTAVSADTLLGISIHTDTEGYQVVSIYRKGAPVTLVVGKNAAGQTIDNGAVWSDGLAAHAGADYLLYADTTDREVRTDADPSTPLVFPGESLTLTGCATYRARLFCFTTDLTVGDLQMNENSSIVFDATPDTPVYKLRGKIAVAGSDAYPTTFYSAKNAVVEVHARLFGEADARLKLSPGNSNNGIRHYDFLADNSGYLGGIEVSQSGGGTPGAAKYMDLRISDETNLGGNPPAFDFHALTLTSYGCLTAVKSLTIDDENRGIFVSGMGQMAVPAGETLTLLSDLTINGGTLFKHDDGTLRFGGKMRYGSSGTASGPGTQATKAVLTVSEGAFQPTKGEACGMIQLVIGEKGCLRIAPQDPDADEALKTKGYVIVPIDATRTGTIAPETTGGKVNIDLAYDASKMSGSFSVPLLTVPSAMAETLRENIKLTHTPMNRHTVSIMERFDEDGNVRFSAHYAAGFTITVR